MLRRMQDPSNNCNGKCCRSLVFQLRGLTEPPHTKEFKPHHVPELRSSNVKHERMAPQEHLKRDPNSESRSPGRATMSGTRL